MSMTVNNYNYNNTTNNANLTRIKIKTTYSPGLLEPLEPASFLGLPFCLGGLEVVLVLDGLVIKCVKISVCFNK